MEKVFKIFAINPGSTSTKVAIYENEKLIDETAVSHAGHDSVFGGDVREQVEAKKKDIEAYLTEHGYKVSDFDALAVRGGSRGKWKVGACKVTKKLSDDCFGNGKAVHPSSMGPIIGYDWSEQYGIPAYNYDVVHVFELWDKSVLSGVKDVDRTVGCHTLNTKAVARLEAKKQGKTYEECKFVIIHMGGGIEVSLHYNGRIVDGFCRDEGAMSPVSSGYVKTEYAVQLGLEKNMSPVDVRNYLGNRCGFISHLGTTDCQEVEKMIADGDKYAELVYNTMAYQIGKNIGAMAAAANGQVDAIIFTGGIANSKMLIENISQYCSWIAPVVVYPGSYEMEALGMGILRVLRGEEAVNDYSEVITED